MDCDRRRGGEARASGRQILAGSNLRAGIGLLEPARDANAVMQMRQSRECKCCHAKIKNLANANEKFFRGPKS